MGWGGRDEEETIEFRFSRLSDDLTYALPPPQSYSPLTPPIQALKHGKYSCFLGPDTALPMMYMPDCIRGTVDLIEAPAEKLKQRVYNMTAVSFTPAQLAASIKKVMPSFTISYAPDFRQKIADSWPRSIDDSVARKQWGWKHEYDTDAMTRDMLEVLGKTVKPAK